MNPKTQKARITGPVAYREGDGPNIRIRPGPCEVVLTAMDATIAWSDGATRGSAAMPIADFRRHLASGTIRMDGPLVEPEPVVAEPGGT